jgi:large subunit ribosomal protein L21
LTQSGRITIKRRDAGLFGPRVIWAAGGQRGGPRVKQTDWKKPFRTASSAHGNEHEDEMFAVIKTGGKQYRVAADDVIKVDTVKGERGDIVEFGEVLVLGGDNVQIGSPTIGGASVAAEVIDQQRGDKVIAFKKRRRQNSRRKRGHRQEFTLLRITEILTEGRRPSERPKAEPRPKRAAPAPDAETDGEAGEDAAPSRRKNAAPKRAAAKKAAPKAASKKAASKKTSGAKRKSAPKKRS